MADLTLHGVIATIFVSLFHVSGTDPVTDLSRWHKQLDHGIHYPECTLPERHKNQYLWPNQTLVPYFPERGSRRKHLQQT